MKQVLQNMKNGQTIVAEVPVPAVREGFALVQTAASLVSAGTERMLVEFAGKSILGKARSRPDLVRQVIDKARREGVVTSLETAFNRLDQPMALGYSSAGRVVALGSQMEGFAVGDRVACAGGGYAVHAEYAVAPKNLLAKIPDTVDSESAAFATLGAIALHGFRLAETQLGERVAVIGLGLLGLLTVQIARSAGCAVFGVDIDPRRVELAQALGAAAVLRSRAEEAARSFSQGMGCDAVLICADTQSDDPVTLAGVIARDKAKVVAVGAVGLEIPRKTYYAKELDLRISRSYGPGRYDPGYEEGGRDYPAGHVRWTEGRNLQAFVELLQKGAVDVHPLISHRFPIDQAPQAYTLIGGKSKEPFLGVLLTYPQTGEPVQRVEVRPASAAIRPAESLRLGVLGAGNYASVIFLPMLMKTGRATRVGIASASGLTAQAAARKFGFDYAASDETQIIQDSEIDLLAILTRHQRHARQIIQGLAAGKHVFCEKPLAITQAQLDELAGVLARGDTPLLMGGFNRRFAPLGMQLKEFIDRRSEALAAHYRVNAGYLPLNHWLHDPEQGGGRIIGEACHFIDFLAFLAGSPPVSVTAHSLPDAGRYRQDNVLLTFTFPDGSIGSVTYLANGDKAFAKERVEVFSGGRVAVLDDFRSLELVHDGRRQAVYSRLRQDKGHRAGWEAFLSAAGAGGPPPIPYDHLLKVAQAALTAVEALAEPGRSYPVALDSSS